MSNKRIFCNGLSTGIGRSTHIVFGNYPTAKDDSLKDLCLYDRAYMGPCTAKPLAGESVCEEHSHKKCANPDCGQQAYRECENTGFLVCGTPFCLVCGKHYNCPWA